MGSDLVLTNEDGAIAGSSGERRELTSRVPGGEVERPMSFEEYRSTSWELQRRMDAAGVVYMELLAETTGIPYNDLATVRQVPEDFLMLFPNGLYLKVRTPETNPIRIARRQEHAGDYFHGLELGLPSGVKIYHEIDYHIDDWRQQRSRMVRGTYVITKTASGYEQAVYAQSSFSPLGVDFEGFNPGVLRLTELEKGSQHLTTDGGGAGPILTREAIWDYRGHEPVAGVARLDRLEYQEIISGQVDPKLWVTHDVLFENDNLKVYMGMAHTRPLSATTGSETDFLSDTQGGARDQMALDMSFDCRAGELQVREGSKLRKLTATDVTMFLFRSALGAQETDRVEKLIRDSFQVVRDSVSMPLMDGTVRSVALKPDSIAGYCMVVKRIMPLIPSSRQDLGVGPRLEGVKVVKDPGEIRKIEAGAKRLSGAGAG